MKAPSFTRRREIAACLAVSIVFVAARALADGQVNATLTWAGDATQLELKGRSFWKYKLRREGPKTVVMNLPPLTSVALTTLRAHSDPLVERVEINKNGVDGTNEVSFYLKSDDTDFFDYQTDDPPRLIVDFFQNEENDGKKTENPESRENSEKKAVGSKPADKKNAGPASRLANKTPKQPSNELPVKRKSSKEKRHPAATEFIQAPAKTGEISAVNVSGDGSAKNFQHGAFDGGDPTFKRFSVEEYEIRESAIIASLRNIYLRFPALSLDSPHLKTLLKNPPLYEIVPRENRENKEARLLLTLFNNKRRAVFLKTAKEFQERYPQSKYDEIIRYMIADTYYELWRQEHKPVDFELAMGLYRHLSERYPESPLAGRTLLLTGYSYLDRDDSFGALKALERFLRVKGKTPFTDQVKISIAEAHLNLNRFEDALERLDEVERTATDKKSAVEAGYRKGDVFFHRKDFAGAVDSYQAALKKYGVYGNQFPNAWYNLAEAQFWQGKYRESLDSYREFLQRFPEHSHGGYAMTRIGELLEIMGIDEKRALGAYLESYFRYRETPGAKVARIRSLVSRMPEMKEKEMASALKEINQLAGTTVLPDINEFTVMSVADGHYRRKEFNRSTTNLIEFYQQNPNATNREKFQSRIVRNITEAIRTNVNDSNFIEALRLNSKYAQTWLKNSDRIDTRFYVGRAYEQAGVSKEAGKVYRETLNQLYAIRGTPREKERSTFEVLPVVDALNLRLAAVAIQDKEYTKAERYLKAIGSPPTLTEKELVERAQLNADLAEASGRIPAAKAFLNQLVETWKGQPSAVSDVYLRLAKLHAREKDYRAADEALTKVINLQTDSGLVSEDTHAAALELKGDVLALRGERAEAVRAYTDLLKSYETTRPLASVRYRAGKILFDTGDIKGAQNLWADLKSDTTDVWNKLANEQLESAKWRGDYKKYIERIPAMQDAKRE